MRSAFHVTTTVVVYVIIANSPSNLQNASGAGVAVYLHNGMAFLDLLVRLRSGLEIEGVPLMQQAFSVKNPILKFNDLSNSSDRDEQCFRALCRA
jgi:hypothetical protein